MPLNSMLAACLVLLAFVRPATAFELNPTQKCYHGSVTVEFKVNAEGLVYDERVIESTPPGLYDREALRVARKWKWDLTKVPLDQPRKQTFNFNEVPCTSDMGVQSNPPVQRDAATGRAADRQR